MPASSNGSQHGGEEVRVDPVSDGVIAVCFEGDLDLANASVFREHIDSALESGSDLIVDLSQATFIDSSGFKVLFHCANAVDGRDQAVVLQLGTAPIVERALELVGIERVLHRAHSRTEALEMIRGQEARG